MADSDPQPGDIIKEILDRITTKEEPVAKKTKKKTTKKKQTYIKGTEPVSIAELDEAIDEYVDVRDQRMELTEQEVETRGSVMDLMKKHKLKTYKSNGRICTLKPGDPKVSVKKEKKPELEE